jgi:hypothetical protein
MKRWYVLHTHPKDEIKVATTLQQQWGLEVYLPQIKGVKSKPFFPCYLFIRVDFFNETALSKMQWVPGLRRGAIWGNKFASGLLDRYLGWTGYDSQQTAEAADPDRPHNLWSPLPGDHGAQGRFADRSVSFSLQAWLNTRLPVVLGAAAGAAVAIWGMRGRRV